MTKMITTKDIPTRKPGSDQDPNAKMDTTGWRLFMMGQIIRLPAISTAKLLGNVKGPALGVVNRLGEDTVLVGFFCERKLNPFFNLVFVHLAIREDGSVEGCPVICMDPKYPARDLVINHAAWAKTERPSAELTNTVYQRLFNNTPGKGLDAGGSTDSDPVERIQPEVHNDSPVDGEGAMDILRGMLR